MTRYVHVLDHLTYSWVYTCIEVQLVMKNQSHIWKNLLDML